jgi:hypothetical protein
LLLVFCGLIALASAQSNFNRLNFVGGGGVGMGRGEVASFVGNSSQGVLGGGMNFSRLFGVDAEYMYYGLGLKPAVSNSQGLPDASGHMQSISLNGIVTVPRHIGRLGAYGIFGIGFYDRHVALKQSQFLENGTPCQPAFIWWDPPCAPYNPTPKIEDPAGGAWISSNSKLAGGFNFGGGVTYRLNALHNSKLFLEWRYHRAYSNDNLYPVEGARTIVIPITVGLRW